MRRTQAGPQTNLMLSLSFLSLQLLKSLPVGKLLPSQQVRTGGHGVERWSRLVFKRWECVLRTRLALPVGPYQNAAAIGVIHCRL